MIETTRDRVHLFDSIHFDCLEADSIYDYVTMYDKAEINSDCRVVLWYQTDLAQVDIERFDGSVIEHAQYDDINSAIIDYIRRYEMLMAGKEF